MESPFFSMIVPIYNVAEEYFTACMESLINQSYKHFEIILVDDGSKKECANLCDFCAGKDQRVRVIHQKNQGVSVARNNGIKEAVAPWILFVDADDWLEEDTLEKLYQYLENADYDILMFTGIREAEQKSIVMNYGLQSNCLYDFSQETTKEFFYRKVMQVPNANKQRVEPIYYSWDKVYRRSFFVDNKLEYPVDVAKSEDKVFISLCLEKTRKLYFVEEALYHYRMNNESVCHRYSHNMDKQRQLLAKCLEPIAVRMDEELGDMYGNLSYCKVKEDYERFMFGIISDVLLLQFYHRDNPNKGNRRTDAIAFLHTEPFQAILRKIPYSSLAKGAKVKKWLLTHDCVFAFYTLRSIENALKRKK